MEQALKEQAPQIDSKFLYQLAVQLEENEKKIALMEPKARFADAISTSKQSVLVGELAKIIAKNGIELGQNRLFAWLRNNEYLHKRGEQYNLPTQMSTDLGIIEVKITTINNPDGSVRVTKTPKITGKGQVYFVNKFIKSETA
jgi:anti-repressor protein